MNFVRRYVTLSIPFLLLLACATKEYTPPPRAALQDPLPGLALLYVMRSPYDDAPLNLMLNEKPATKLPPSTYTVLSLSPGRYVLGTSGVVDKATGQPSIPAFAFEVQAGQRLFLHLPAPERRYVPGFSLVPFAKGLVLPVQQTRAELTGAQQVWTVTEEQDVHWFLHYSKLYLEPSAAP